MKVIYRLQVVRIWTERESSVYDVELWDGEPIRYLATPLAAMRAPTEGVSRAVLTLLSRRGQEFIGTLPNLVGDTPKSDGYSCILVAESVEVDEAMLATAPVRSHPCS